MPLLSCLSRTWSHIQGNLFPWLTEELGPLTETHKQVVTALEVAGVEAFVQVWPGLPGRPPCDRAALARAFVAKALIGLPTTSMLVERLKVDKQLRRLCGWESRGELSSEATFSRAFAEFARSGTKRNAKGHTTSWIGYKLHLDVVDGDIPISAVLTSASLHDSQAAIPLAMMTASRVINLYDLMDSAYDAPEIKAKSLALGHVPIIDPHPRNVPGGKKAIAAEARGRRNAGYALAEEVRYNERSAAERVNGGLKDDFGGRYVRVCGHAKVFCHLMFGVLALAIDHLMRLIT
jgi:Transposase DDE domain/Transposase domain (DUF772)